MSFTGTKLLRRYALPSSLFIAGVQFGGLLVLLVFLILPCLALPGGQESFSGVFLPSNRLDSRGIEQAKQLIAKGHFSQAIRFLDGILAREEDSFLSARTSVHSGLKETARQMLRDLPPEGRRSYETTLGPAARRLLKQSLQPGGFEQLRQITQRYFYTPAGYEAALLFAQHEADQGRHLSAAFQYQQLLETAEAAARFEPQLSILAAANWLAADNPTRAEELLLRLSEQGFRNIQLSGKDLPLRVSQDDRVDWLMQVVGIPVTKDWATQSQWLTARGNPARNGQVEGGLPHLRVRWQVRLLEHHHLEAVHDELAGMLSQQKRSRLPAAIPLAVGDYVITRSAHGLIAIDFKTGKRVWQAQPPRVSPLEDLIDGNFLENENNRKNKKLESAQIFGRLMWEDYLYNSTSSDGKRVYVIRDLAPPKFDRSQPFRLVPPASDKLEDSSTNRLCAYDLPTEGKLVWEIDGANRRGQLAGAYFLGAPVTVGQSLYCLAEIQNETAIYLLALDRQTGALRWRQQLADLEQGISHDRKRRLQASMPSYDEGVLVCPTGAGWVVGVDLAKQSLAWAYHYPSKKRLTPRQRIMEVPTRAAKGQWVQSTPVVAEGRVLLAPPESDTLHCLDLQTGKLLWKQPRGDAFLLAGVEAGKVLLVGNRQLSALQLSDGESAWKEEYLELPAGCTPTGSGFFSRGQYFLPLSNARVIAVDVSDGTIVAKANSRKGQPLGNLICYRGAVISQTGRYLDCFEQVEVLREDSERRLDALPTDLKALRTLGEIAYYDGQLAQAIELLSQAHASEPDDLRTREVLGEALVVALNEEFSEYQHRLPLLEEIHQGSAEDRFTLMRLRSQGQLEIGQAQEAFAICLQAYKNLDTLEAELSVGRDHLVSPQRWLAAQVAAVWNSASGDQRTAIRAQLAPLLAQTRAATETSLWQHFYDCFCSLELTAPLGIELATAYLQQGETLAAQQLLLSLIESENVHVQNGAIALNSRLLHESKRPVWAAKFDRVLQGKLAHQECLPGKTGLECLAAWKAADASPPSWPYGQVEVSVEKYDTRSSSRKHRRSSGILLQRSDSLLGSCSVTLLDMASGRNPSITLRDSLGQEFFRATLDQGAQAILSARRGVQGVSRGNLLILSLGHQIVAFDTTIAIRGATNAQPLWQKNTTSRLHALNPLGLRGNSATQIGPVTRDSCIFQVEQQLVCVDVRTGETKWSRDNLPVGCDLWGDADYVFAVPQASKHALVFSTVDGRSLGETSHHLPSANEHVATVGRQIVCWRRCAERRRELVAIDSWSGEVLWKHVFEKNARFRAVQNRFVAVVEPAGRCRIIEIRHGQAVVDQPIDANAAMTELYLLVGTNSFVLAVQQPPKVDKMRRVSPFNTTDFTRTAFAGQIYLFDRNTGLAVWEQPAKVQRLPLMLSQAVDMPVIAFAGNIRRTGKQGSKNQTGIMLLEKSTGRMLFLDEHLPPSPHYCFFQVAEEEAGGNASVAVVEMMTRKIQLQFTDHPRAPEPPARHDVLRNVGSGSGGLQKIGEKFFRGS